MAASLRGLLALPSFLYGVFAMFWCFQLASLTGFLKFWKFGKPRNDVEGVITFLKAVFGFKVVKVGNEELFLGKCVYLANHRSWADFFVDAYVIGARGVPLSRRAVGMAFPAFTTSLVAIRAILLFNRGGVRDLEKFNAWLDRAYASAHEPSLLVYPEGTRSLRQTSLPLKRGMLRYAHTRRLPVQVVITAYKEEVLNERNHSIHYGRTLVAGFSEVLDATKYDDFDEFIGVVQATWDALWQRVHAAPREGPPELPPNFPEKSYRATTLARQSAALSAWGAVLVAALYCTLRMLAALAAWTPAGPYLVGGLGLYVVVSMAAACLVPPPKPRASTRKQD